MRTHERPYGTLPDCRVGCANKRLGWVSVAVSPVRLALGFPSDRSNYQSVWQIRAPIVCLVDAQHPTPAR